MKGGCASASTQEVGNFMKADVLIDGSRVAADGRSLEVHLDDGQRGSQLPGGEIRFQTANHLRLDSGDSQIERSHRLRYKERLPVLLSVVLPDQANS